MAVYVGDKIAEPKYILIGNKSVYQVYLGDELVWEKDYATSAPYGFLYNNYAVEDVKGIAPSGWHVPSLVEYIALFGIGGEDEGIGGTLKGTATEPDAHPRWKAPNIGATNSLSFDGYGGGYREDDGTFDQHGYKGMWWASDGYFFGLANDSSDYFFGDIFDPRYGLSVRLIKDDAIIGSGTMTDNDGNVYNTVLINGAVWMKENLRVTSFADTTKIANVVEDIDWKGLSTSAYCIYNYEVVDKKPTFHNKLNGLQGGKEFDEYYHLTQAEYEALCSVPSGGTTGQALIKASDDDCDLAWGDASGELDIPSLDPKTTPVDADLFVGADSEDTFINKKFTWANIKATLKTYFDTLYATVASLTNYARKDLFNTFAANNAFNGNSGIAILGKVGEVFKGNMIFLRSNLGWDYNNYDGTLTTNLLTTDRTWSLPNKTGTLAVTDDIEWQADTNGVKLKTDADNVGIGAGSDASVKLYVKAAADASVLKAENISLYPLGAEILIENNSSLFNDFLLPYLSLYRRNESASSGGFGGGTIDMYCMNNADENYLTGRILVGMGSNVDGSETTRLQIQNFNTATSSAVVILDENGNVQVVQNLVLLLDGFTYYGGISTDGSWRHGRSGNNFVHQRRESGNWVTKQTISA